MVNPHFYIPMGQQQKNYCHILIILCFRLPQSQIDLTEIGLAEISVRCVAQIPFLVKFIDPWGIENVGRRWLYSTNTEERV